jgi:hypothetical protein
MFQSIDVKYLGTDCEYTISDTKFTSSTIKSRYIRSVYVGEINYERTIIETYSARKFNVPANLALFYLEQLCRRRNRKGDFLKNYITTWCDEIDLYFPELEYGKRYYDCVVRHIRQLQFGRKTHPI